MDSTPIAARFDRRAFLVGASAIVLGACSDDDGSDEAVADDPTTSVATDTGSETTAPDPTDDTETDNDNNDQNDDDGEIEALTPANFESLAVCALLPASTSGPFPSRELLDRRDIHEGVPGQPFRLGIRVVDGGCQPVPGAVVEIWHTDATGDYSDYEDGGSGKDEGEGTTFCRGAQTADENGILEFETIYPGWYGGRAVHIHTTVHVDDAPVLTAQLYFDEGYTEAVHTTGEYAQFGPPDTGWDDDGIIGDPSTDGTGIVLADGMTRSGPGTVGLVNLGVDLG